MASCPGEEVDAPRIPAWAGAPQDVQLSVVALCGEPPHTEESAPQQPLLHALSTPVGGLLLVGGLVMLVLPGPSLPLFFLGLGLLGREYEWARRLLDAVARRMPDRWRRAITVRAVDVAPGSVRPSDAS